MHGFLILDSKSGRLLSYREYTPSFGLRHQHEPASSHSATIAGCQETRDEERPIDPFYLSALMFALHSNAIAVQSDGDETNANSNDAGHRCNDLALQTLQSADVALDCILNSSSSALCVVFTSLQLSSEHRCWIARKLLDMHSKRKITSKQICTELYTLLDTILRELLRRVPQPIEPPWIFVISSTAITKTRSDSKPELERSNFFLSSIEGAHTPRISMRKKIRVCTRQKWWRWMYCGARSSITSSPGRGRDFTKHAQVYRLLHSRPDNNDSLKSAQFDSLMSVILSSNSLLSWASAYDSSANSIELHVARANDDERYRVLVFIHHDIVLALPVKGYGDTLQSSFASVCGAIDSHLHAVMCLTQFMTKLRGQRTRHYEATQRS